MSRIQNDTEGLLLLAGAVHSPTKVVKGKADDELRSWPQNFSPYTVADSFARLVSLGACERSLLGQRFSMLQHGTGVSESNCFLIVRTGTRGEIQITVTSCSETTVLRPLPRGWFPVSAFETDRAITIRSSVHTNITSLLPL